MTSLSQLSKKIEDLENTNPSNRIENIVITHGPGEPIEVINIWGAGIRKILPGDPEYARYLEGAG